MSCRGLCPGIILWGLHPTALIRLIRSSTEFADRWWLTNMHGRVCLPALHSRPIYRVAALVSHCVLCCAPSYLYDFCRQWLLLQRFWCFALLRGMSRWFHRARLVRPITQRLALYRFWNDLPIELRPLVLAEIYNATSRLSFSSLDWKCLRYTYMHDCV